MKKLLVFAILVFTASMFAQNAWLNEIHYDNGGTDEGEFLEIVIENAGSYDLSDFEVTLYNASNQESYGSASLDSFDEGDTENGFTFFSLDYPGIQNGEADGVAISHDGDLIQFLSYEGTLTAIGGPADGVESVDIGVSESGGTQIGESLQLSGTGETYASFVWQEAASETPGSLNNNQAFGEDTSPPSVNSVYVMDETSLRVSFSENVDETTAEEPGNYAITNRVVTVENAERDVDVHTIVVLTVSGMTAGNYTLTVNDVEDLLGNACVNATAPFTYTPVIEFEDFEDLTLGDWTANSQGAPDNDWYADEYGGDRFAKISGFQATEFCDDWLISPELDLSVTQNEYLSFRSATNYDGPILEVLVSNNYNGTGDPSDFDWDALDPVLAEQGWIWAESGQIDISSFSGPSVYIAFHYTSDATGTSTWEVDDITIAEMLSSENVEINSIAVINNIFPNPFNPNTNIAFTITESSAFVNLVIYNAKGQKIKTLINEQMNSGSHIAKWDGTNDSNLPVSSGIYFGKFDTSTAENSSGRFTSTKKMVLLK